MKSAQFLAGYNLAHEDRWHGNCHLRDERGARHGRSVIGTVMCTLILVILLAFGTHANADAFKDSTRESVDDLIDDLVNIDAQSTGLHSTLLINADVFIAEDAAAQVRGGVFGSIAPKQFPQMVELVRRGTSALPSLIAHLGDRRATKLTVGSYSPRSSAYVPGHFFFVFQYFDDEYDPRTGPTLFQQRRAEFADRDMLLKQAHHEFKEPYTVKVGDICYFLIGQIVNRTLIPVRYQPSAILVVNSPIEAPVLVEDVQRDWGGVDSDKLMRSLLADLHADRQTALARLRFYFPAEYERQIAAGFVHPK